LTPIGKGKSKLNRPSGIATNPGVETVQADFSFITGAYGMFGKKRIYRTKSIPFWHKLKFKRFREEM